MSQRPFTREDLAVLEQWDTPTICNGLELIVPERRAIGFTVEPMVAADPKLKPMVGLARVGMIRAAEADLPTVVVLQDLDDRPGYGAWWGEVNSAIHKALGALGCVTNGSFRDLEALAPGFQIVGGRVGPSHAHVHIVTFGHGVDVFGMHVSHDDVIHADHHGAVVVPADAVRKLPDAIDLISRREKVILDMVRSPEFKPPMLREALKRAGEIH